jgi:hypothetical protein
MPLKGDAVDLAQRFRLRCSSASVFGSAALPDKSNRFESVPRSLLSQFNELSVRGDNASGGTATAAAAVAATEETVAAVVEDEAQWLLPVVIDFDCAEVLDDDAVDSCDVDISRAGARTELVKRFTNPISGAASVGWTLDEDQTMANHSCLMLWG